MYSPAGELLILGALPMANVLAVGLLVGLRRPESSPALPGFVTFGAMALALYVALTLLFTDQHDPANLYLSLLNAYLGPWGDFVEKHLGQSPAALLTGPLRRLRHHARLAASGLRTDRRRPFPQV